MTNLEAFKQAYNGGSLTMFDNLYEIYLNKIGMVSINDLKDMGDWLDLMASVSMYRHRSREKVLNLYDLCKRAYLIKYAQQGFLSSS